MAEHEARAEWSGGTAFDVSIDRHSIRIDTVTEHGGRDSGPSPKKLLLAGLAGCTGMDVVSLLTKMRVPFERFALEIEADQTEDHPRVYHRITVRYILTGDGLDREKVEKAVALSREKYCGVSAMLGKTAEIRTEIVLNPASELPLGE